MTAATAVAPVRDPASTRRARTGAGWTQVAAATVAGEPLAVWAAPGAGPYPWPVPAAPADGRPAGADPDAGAGGRPGPGVGGRPGPGAGAAAGPCAGPVVVAVHGMEDTWQTWRPVTELLRPARVYALDLPWRSGGDYRWAADRTPAGWLAAALELVPERADALLAHSFGAGAALAHLADGYQVGAAVLAAPFYRPDVPAGRPLDEAGRAESLAGFAEVVGDGLRARMGARAATVDPEVFAAMRGRLLDRVVPVAGDPFLEAFVRSGRLDLRAVTVPTLVLAGSADVSLIPARAAALAAAMPAADVRQRDHYTHFCQLVQAAAVAAEVRTFFDRHLTPRKERR